MRFDYIIIGSGFTGSVLARRLAEEKSKKVLVLERRNHIGGNMYDEEDEHGILVQRYGVHVFHTDKEEVFQYLSRFTKWNDYSITCLANIQGRAVPVPFNYSCIDAFWTEREAERLKKKLELTFLGMERIPVLDLLASDDSDIRAYGEFLFENDYKPYTCKQWGRRPEEIDTSILTRVKVALSYDDRYFTNRFQCMPANGFTSLFQTMLTHPNITIETGCDAKPLISFDDAAGLVRVKGYPEETRVIYTGALDQLMDYAYGTLPYRTLRFVYTSYSEDKHLAAPFVVYPLHETMTREVEFKSITGQTMKGVTTVVEEYPREYDHANPQGLDPFYPIISQENEDLFAKYKLKAQMYANLITCGRLADYRYYDMDNAVMRAFEVFEGL